MKKYIITLLLLFSSLVSFTCDICGCGVGSYYLGILPEFRKRFIGFRYQAKGLRNHVGFAGQSTYLTSEETFRIAELWGAANFGNRFRVIGFFPYNMIEKQNQGMAYSKKGLGDIAVVGYYQLLNAKHTVGEKLLVQSLWAGGGFKLPTGAYDDKEKNAATGVQNSFQLGSGSLDFSLNAAYDIRLQDAGINTTMSYKFNFPNRYDYRYGNKFNLGVLAYYKIRLANQFTLSPNAGLQYEAAGKDQEDKQIEVFATGGYSLAGVAGIEFAFNRLGVGANFQTPASQHLGEGKIDAKDRVMVYASLSF